MKSFGEPAQFDRQGRKVCLAIGVFDGVHLGHQQVLRQSITDAAQHHAWALAVTFDRHPSVIVSPKNAPAPIYSLPQKLRVLGAFGLAAAWTIRFDEEFSRQSGETFVRNLARDFGPVLSICVGSGFRFGHGRAGNVSLLQELGRELGFSVHGLAAVSLDGLAVSSTRIRESIRNGNLDAASQMLGRPYSVSGKVISGDGVGNKLGFPTANVDVAGLTLPPNGVYAAQVQFQDQTLPAALNLGYRPTLQSTEPQLRMEVHLLDFAQNLVGQELEVIFVERLRDEQKFPSLDALQHQITADIAKARELFGE